MRNLILYLTAFLFSFNVAFGQNDDVTECPFFNVSSTDTSGVVFSLLSSNVDATISGVIANVIVDQTYYNSGDSTVDATYVFPMSSKAAIYAMSMLVNDRLILAEIRRKDEAQEIFDAANDAGLTASLLEQERPNVFQMSLANIAPGDSIQVRIVYTELMVPTGGVYQFVFPSVVGPRFTTNGEPWVSQANQDSSALAATELNINLKINAGMPLTAESISHDALFNISGNNAQTSISTNPGDDFIVNYTLDDNQVTTGLLLYEGEEENFFLSIVQPARPDVPFESPRREYIFIMDISGSMLGEPIEISKILITNLLSDLNAEDRFNIIFFAGASSVFAPSSLLATTENINSAITAIDNVAAGGGTQLLPAMQTALTMDVADDYSRVFAILTDGFVAVEAEAYNLIRANLNEANFFSFGIGNSVNRFIIEGIAYVGEGEPFVVSDGVDPYEVADQFKEYIENPVLNNLAVSFEGINVYDVEPLTIPDVFAERPIIIYGKYEGDAEGEITITGDYAEGSLSSTLNFSDYAEDADENTALKYLWARKKIRLMSDYGIASNETDTVSIEEEITLLGLRYSLVTAYTSFIAVDSNAVSTTSTDPDGDDDDDGGIVEVDNLSFSSSSEREFIKVFGTVTQLGEMLKLKLENIAAISTSPLTLQITNLNGQVLTTYQVKPADLENLINIPLNGVPAGLYVVSLVSKSQVIDAEKFVVR